MRLIGFRFPTAIIGLFLLAGEVAVPAIAEIRPGAKLAAVSVGQASVRPSWLGSAVSPSRKGDRFRSHFLTAKTCYSGQRSYSRTYHGDLYSYSTTLNVTFQYHSDCSPPSVAKVYCTADYGYVGHTVTINLCGAAVAHPVAKATTVEEDATINIAYGLGGFYNIWQTISSDGSGNVKCNEDLPQYASC